ncbi:hypothetical protein H6504_04785 [Candidatus Woesearchaeota archaeon]|nr:hypothetical protein [Candidatus Woesearchaeota archaeon]
MHLIDRISIGVSYFLRFTLIIATGSAIYQQQWLLAFLTISIFIMTWIPALIERNIKVNMPSEIEITMILFVYAALFLGEVHSFYERLPWWDLFLHASSSIVLGFLGFIIIFVLYHGKQVHAAPGVMAVFAFCFGMAIGAVWEIFEFGVDQFFGMNMQKSGLIDTMSDLIIDACGSLLVAVSGFFYLKSGRSYVLHHLLVRFAKENPEMFGDKLDPILKKRSSRRV